MSIRRHLGSDLIGKRNVAFLEDRMHPAYTDTVSTFQMTHRRIPAGADHTDHGLTVVVKDEVGISTPQLLP